jgi:hypothetical protein
MLCNTHSTPRDSAERAHSSPLHRTILVASGCTVQCAGVLTCCMALGRSQATQASRSERVHGLPQANVDYMPSCVSNTHHRVMTTCCVTLAAPQERLRSVLTAPSSLQVHLMAFGLHCAVYGCIDIPCGALVVSSTLGKTLGACSQPLSECRRLAHETDQFIANTHQGLCGHVVQPS